LKLFVNTAKKVFGGPCFIRVVILAWLVGTYGSTEILGFSTTSSLVSEAGKQILFLFGKNLEFWFVANRSISAVAV
jgi:hypothetical protein